MAELAVITPLHHAGNEYITECWESLRTQTGSWRWYILENNGGKVPRAIASDPRVKALRRGLPPDIGALKRYTTHASVEPYVLELDCDDILAPNAVSQVLEAFAQGAEFVYSDFAEFTVVRGQWVSQRLDYPYGTHYGWHHYDVRHGEQHAIAMSAPPVTAQNIRLVDWAPNHLRAWSREIYNLVGGHDADLAVADDHDLIVRMFLAGAKFVHIPQCLYFYRVHDNNTVGARNAAIRDGTWGVYNRNIWKLAEKFAKDSGLQKIDLCGALDCPEGYTPIDSNLGREQTGILCDLNWRWKLADASVGVLRASDAVEHLRDPIHVMNEAYRVLAPGGFFMISVPSSSGKGAFCDPTHVSFWNDLSFRYYTDQNFARYIPAYEGRFQVSRVIEWFPSEWHRQNNVPYAEAQLIKLGAGYEPMGEVLWPERC
jgi:hypothetical protein